MQLFYTPDITLPQYTLCEEESKHAVRVLRLVVGDHIWLTDGKGTMYEAKVVDPNPKRCTVEVVKSVENYNKRNYELTMAVAPPKNMNRYEWFLEKATEVGCDKFIPLESFHSERRKFNNSRAERVVTSAVKQSIKAYHPILDPITDIKDLMEHPFEGVKLIAHCHAEMERLPLFEAVGRDENVLVLIGPEGDFSKEEVELAMSKGFKPITLGDTRLRIETAAITAVIGVAFINQ